jgi:2-iminobutanoate/2-iminopropanoate deaminase
MVRTIATEEAPAAVGAYSQATTDERLMFTAGQLPMTPEGTLLDEASIGEQTERVLDNVEAVLHEENLSMHDVLKVTIFLENIDDFEEMNEVYGSYFGDSPPARSAVEVAALPKGAGIEIEVVASA